MIPERVPQFCGNFVRISWLVQIDHTMAFHTIHLSLTTASRSSSLMMTPSNGNISRVTVTGHLCGNSPVSGEFPAQRPVTRSFHVFFDRRPNKRLSKQSWGRWFEKHLPPLWRHSNGSLWRSDGIWRHRSWPTLTHVMACCLTAPSHHMFQCWHLTGELLWHSPESRITARAQATVLYNDPDSKVHGAYMGPIWGRQDPGGPHVGPMNFDIWGVWLLYFTIGSSDYA